MEVRLGPLLVDVGLKFEGADGWMDVWYLIEGQVKSWGGWLELSLSQLSLEVVD